MQSSAGFTKRFLDENSYYELKKVMFGSNVTPDDVSRWYSQGFVFCDNFPMWGLKQAQGGPCGILASVQAEIIRELCFSQSKISLNNLQNVSSDELNQVFMNALMNILKRSSQSNRKYIIVNRVMGKVLSSSSSEKDFEIFEISDYSEAHRILSSCLESLKSESGVVLFLMSLILTRGVENIKADMDDEFNSVGDFCVPDFYIILS